MARSDLIINLAKAGSHGDRTLLRRTLEALIAEERAKQHNLLANRLEEVLKNGGSRLSDPTIPMIKDEKANGLFFEVTPQIRIDDLVLPKEVVAVFHEIVEEHHRRELLRSHNLEPRHRILLVGPPGNGKTSLAHAFAEATILPLIVVRYEGIIGSYLGETAARLRRLFDFVRTRACVLFFDEFDTLGKERGDIHDTGEIKRVVSSLLLQIDDLPSHVIVVTATNHDELLDRAVWRRFQVRLFLPPPERHQLEVWFTRFQERLGEKIGHSPDVLAEKLIGLSFSEIQEFCLDVLRRRVLQLPGGDIKIIVKDRLKYWGRQVRPKRSSKPKSK
ncbi:MAG: ATP-binding protein [Desulfomonilaceae bacterium]